MTLKNTILRLTILLSFSPPTFAKVDLGWHLCGGSYSSQKLSDLPSVNGYVGGLYKQTFKICGLENNKTYELVRTEFVMEPASASTYKVKNVPNRIFTPNNGCITGERTIALFNSPTEKPLTMIPVMIRDLSNDRETINDVADTVPCN